jgi:hypothetical protein
VWERKKEKVEEKCEESEREGEKGKSDEKCIYSLRLLEGQGNILITSR